jgi:hypothetical protein
MALTQTTLTSDITASQLAFAVGSTTGFAAGQPVLIGGEYMWIVSIPASGIVKVRSRGSEGTAAVAHDTLSNVCTSATLADFPAVPVGAVSVRPPYVDDVVDVGENGTIACPDKDTTYVLTKATALASTTLGTPTKAQNGVRVTFTSQTAAAHVITATMEDGTTGGSTTATFTAFIGASMILEACNAVWNVIAVQNVTIT